MSVSWCFSCQHKRQVKTIKFTQLADDHLLKTLTCGSSSKAMNLIWSPGVAPYEWMISIWFYVDWILLQMIHPTAKPKSNLNILVSVFSSTQINHHILNKCGILEIMFENFITSGSTAKFLFTCGLHAAKHNFKRKKKSCFSAFHHNRIHPHIFVTYVCSFWLDVKL